MSLWIRDSLKTTALPGRGVPADEERLSFVAGGIFDQGEVQPFEALRTSTLAREGALLDSEHPQRVEGVVTLLVGPRRELSGQL